MTSVRQLIDISDSIETNLREVINPDTREPFFVLEVKWSPTTYSPKPSTTGAPLEPVVLTVPRTVHSSVSDYTTSPGEIIISCGGRGERQTVMTRAPTGGKNPRSGVKLFTLLDVHIINTSWAEFLETYYTVIHLPGPTKMVKSATSSLRKLKWWPAETNSLGLMAMQLPRNASCQYRA